MELIDAKPFLGLPILESVLAQDVAIRGKVYYPRLHKFRLQQLENGIDLKGITDTQMGLQFLERCHHISNTQPVKDGGPSYRVRVCKTCCQGDSHIELGTYVDQESAIIVNDAHEIMHDRFSKLAVLRKEDKLYLNFLTVRKYDRHHGEEISPVLELIAERTSTIPRKRSKSTSSITSTTINNDTIKSSTNSSDSNSIVTSEAELSDNASSNSTNTSSSNSNTSIDNNNTNNIKNNNKNRKKSSSDMSSDISLVMSSILTPPQESVTRKPPRSCSFSLPPASISVTPIANRISYSAVQLQLEQDEVNAALVLSGLSSGNIAFADIMDSPPLKIREDSIDVDVDIEEEEVNISAKILSNKFKRINKAIFSPDNDTTISAQQSDYELDTSIESVSFSQSPTSHHHNSNSSSNMRLYEYNSSSNTSGSKMKGRPRSHSLSIVSSEAFPACLGRPRADTIACDDSSSLSNGDSSFNIGSYSPESRKRRIERFLAKRKRRIWKKTVKYDVRKVFADSRIRIKGRFVKKDEEKIDSGYISCDD